MRHYDPEIAAALRDLDSKHWNAGLHGDAHWTTTQAIQRLVDEAGMYVETSKLADDLAEARDLLGKHLDAAGVPRESMLLYQRRQQDLDTIVAHQNALYDLLKRRAAGPTAEMVNGHASLEHLVLEDLPL